MYLYLYGYRWYSLRLIYPDYVRLLLERIIVINGISCRLAVFVHVSKPSTRILYITSSVFFYNDT